jgi:hypothetical protein
LILDNKVNFVLFEKILFYLVIVWVTAKISIIGLELGLTLTPTLIQQNQVNPDRWHDPNHNPNPGISSANSGEPQLNTWIG